MPTDTRESTSSCSASWSLRLQLQPVIKLPTDTMEDAPAAPAAAAAVPTRRVTGTMIGAGSLVGQQVAVVGKVSNQTGTSVELVSAVRVVASYVRAPWWSGLWPLVWCVCGWRTLTHCWLCVAGRLACARGVGFRSQPVQVRGFSCCCSPTPCVLPHACAHWRVCRVAAPCSAFVEIVGTVRADGTVVEVRRAAFGDSFGALARAHTHGCMVESSRHASQTWAPTKSSWNSPTASTARCSCEKCAGCVASQVNTQSLGLSYVSHVGDACTHAKQLLQSGGICWLNCLRVWRPP